MRTDTESLWVLALSSKCKDFTSVWFVFLGGSLVWLLLLTLIHWAYPGGPAWGKYRLSRAFNLDYFIMMMMTRDPIPMPAGPRGFPVIGSMNLMAGLAHHRIAAVADACGAKRLMAFSVGQTRVVVTCNPDVAKQILNSWKFVDRPLKESAYALMFNRAIGFAPYGVYWRTLRRITATHLFCPKQIKASQVQRFEIVHQMVAMFCTAGRGGGGGDITVRDALKRASLNNMMWSVFGRKYPLDSFNPEAHELRTLVDQGYQLLGTLNWSDHLPWLGDYFDPQKVRFRCSELVPKVNRFVSRIIADHRSAQPDQLNRDFVHVLLSLQGPDKLSDSDMIAVLWEMIFRGTDTVAVLIEWILARMVLHPDVQSKAHDELDKVVGRSRAVTEADVAEMVYLRAVVKEVLRLHPPGPLLSWSRLASTDATVDGHHVPAGTTAMVNMWAIMRDPDVWSDPLEFKPERLVAEADDGVEFSVLGSDHRLAPFGSGTRACPGRKLGLTTVTFWTASLLHEFEWWPSDQNIVDLSEVLRLSCEMANPLAVKVRPRRIRSLFSTRT